MNNGDNEEEEISLTFTLPLSFSLLFPRNPVPRVWPQEKKNYDLQKIRFYLAELRKVFK